MIRGNSHRKNILKKLWHGVPWAWHGVPKPWHSVPYRVAQRATAPPNPLKTNRNQTYPQRFWPKMALKPLVFIGETPLQRQLRKVCMNEALWAGDRRERV